ncbi:MAG: phosphoribosylanthranilate isomerase [Chloroflexi bacterium]|nr:phosphoribosylanthranilate isomerase [Chloroflexota bacterium]
MTTVKICGIRFRDHALAAVDAGADMLGFVFAPSRRQVRPEEIAPVAAAARAAAASRGRTVACVGVFVNEDALQIRAIARQCGLDSIQLSGAEPVEIAAALAPLTIIKAVRFDDSPAERAWLAYESPAVRLLVDAHAPGCYGGAGIIADWSRAAVLARHRTILLAGGLTPDNVATAIAQVRPWGVDVSSGVETGGVKDSHKIHAFIEAVRATPS